MYDKAVLKLLQFSFCYYVISVCACHDPSSLEQTLKLLSKHTNRQIMNDRTDIKLVVHATKHSRKLHNISSLLAILRPERSPCF